MPRYRAAEVRHTAANGSRRSGAGCTLGDRYRLAMDGLGLAAVTGALGFAGLATSIWSTKEASRVARHGRVDEKRIDACVEILRLVEHKTLWFKTRVTAAEIAGDPFENAPRLPREPDVGEQAIIETLLAAYGSSRLKDACVGWTGAALAMDKQLEMAAWNWEQAYHGPETPTSPDDLAELRLRLEALGHEKRSVEVAVAQEVERIQNGVARAAR
jgi:hypothetical protein